MLIEVTQQHIDRGLPGDCEDCPIALALKEKEIAFYAVKSWMVIGKGFTVDLPQSAKDFIKLFDGQEDYRTPVEPFEFELAI